ncbi:MAG TPA: TonB-dependent receptor [Candidatus Eisenbacteria bacterium]|jgi:iron complex outermembrane receptor protein
MIVAILLAAVVTAQSASDSLAPPRRPDTLVTLPEVRVEGERLARDARRRLPTAFVSDLATGMTGHALETLAEVLGRASGVRVVQYGGLGAFSTVSLRGAPAGQVSVFLDGSPLTSASHGVVDLSGIPATAVERIEVYRGLGPLALGAATPGGAINLVTLASSARLEARLARGSFDTWEGRAVAGLKRGRVRAMVHAGYQGSAGDFRFFDDNATPYEPGDDGISTRVNNRFDAAGALARLAFEPARGWSVTAREDLFRKQQGVPGLGATPATRAALRFVRSLSQLEVASPARGAVPRVRLSGALTRERSRSRDRTGELGLGHHDADDRFAGEEGTFGLEWTRIARVLALEATGSLREERAALHDAADGHPDPPGSVRLTRGASLALQLRPLRDRLVLHAARRWERLEDHLRSTSSLGRLVRSDVARETEAPQLGARLGVAAGLELKANWSRAERPPDFMELFGNQGSVLGNPALRPEHGESWDAGGRLATAGAGLTGALEWSHFESDLRDLIAYAKSTPSAVRAYNATRGVIRGEELSLTLGGPWGLAASASATAMEARDRGSVRAYRGKHLPQRPERQASAQVECRRARISTGADLEYLGPNYLDPYNQNRAPSRTLAGAWLSYTEPRHGLRLTIEGKNLGDRLVSDVGGYPLPGRSVFVSCEARFTHD